MSILLPVAPGGLIIWLDPEADAKRPSHQARPRTSGPLGATIERCRTERAGRILVDATALRFIDVSGYRALAACRTVPLGTGDQVAVRTGPAVARLRHLLELAGCSFERSTAVA